MSSQIFGERLRELRLNEGITQRELAIELGVTKICISHYERGKREPDIETLKFFARRFNTTIDHIIDLRQIE